LHGILGGHLVVKTIGTPFGRAVHWDNI
jgi:hypothetical protein